MDLSTRYLGFDLDHPLIPGASPLTGDVDGARRLEDAGAPMLIMCSLFEEELKGESLAAAAAIEEPKEQFAEALSYLPEPENYVVGPEQYLDRIFKLKEAVSVPVVASLNGTTRGGWLRYAQKIEEAGADALELNLYMLPTSTQVTAREMEAESFGMIEELRKLVSIPVAVKLSPFYTSLPNVAAHMKQAGADALVLFNRFYQPDIDIEELELARKLELSTPSELLLRLRWLAILAAKVDVDLAVTGGVHRAEDAVKAVMCGARVCQIVSALLIHGPGHLNKLREQMYQWFEEHEYVSLNQAHGSMSLERCPDPGAYARANYLHLLRSWQAEMD